METISGFRGRFYSDSRKGKRKGKLAFWSIMKTLYLLKIQGFLLAPGEGFEVSKQCKMDTTEDRKALIILHICKIEKTRLIVKCSA